MSTPYDPYTSSNQREGGNQKTQQVQQQVNEVVDIIQENIDKSYQRGIQINEIQGKTDDLQSTSIQFHRGANQVRRNMWWKDWKWKVLIAVVIIIVLGLVIGSIVGSQQHN